MEPELDGMELEPNTTEPNYHLPKSAQVGGEEAIGSELSSEISSLPPPGDDEDANCGKDQQMPVMEPEMSLQDTAPANSEQASEREGVLTRHKEEDAPIRPPSVHEPSISPPPPTSSSPPAASTAQTQEAPRMSTSDEAAAETNPPAASDEAVPDEEKVEDREDVTDGGAAESPLAAEQPAGDGSIAETEEPPARGEGVAEGGVSVSEPQMMEVGVSSGEVGIEDSEAGQLESLEDSGGAKEMETDTTSPPGPPEGEGQEGVVSEVTPDDEHRAEIGDASGREEKDQELAQDADDHQHPEATPQDSKTTPQQPEATPPCEEDAGGEGGLMQQGCDDQSRDSGLSPHQDSQRDQDTDPSQQDIVEGSPDAAVQEVQDTASPHQDTAKEVQDKVEESQDTAKEVQDKVEESQDTGSPHQDTVEEVRDEVEENQDLPHQDTPEESPDVSPSHQDSPDKTASPHQDSTELPQDTTTTTTTTSPQQQDSNTEDVLQDHTIPTTAAEVSPGSPAASGPAEVSHMTPPDPGGPIEALLVHAEDEDLSVFSSEAAEADQLQALTSSGSVGGGGSSTKLSSMTSTALGGGGGGGAGRQSGRGVSPGTAPPVPPLSVARSDIKRVREEKQEVSHFGSVNQQFVTILSRM